MTEVNFRRESISPPSIKSEEWIYPTEELKPYWKVSKI